MMIIMIIGDHRFLFASPNPDPSIKRELLAFESQSLIPQYSIFLLKMMLHFIISFRHHYGGITDRNEESFKNSLMQDAVLTFATKSYRGMFLV